ncbi:hypothetical protein C8E00_103336 [Chromohalobacter marismortui]|uniref:Toxin CptA n=1 Tax=Chromohalobacter marismortui TaxID=42055 RepID=A0A4R7NPW4_9GAMM|nr:MULTISPECIES: hypothetical protein [Chromohalobacter]MCI0508484.1 hypothetical protein [Chromohalobacter sp.]MCI0592225.1 hypothetical protein [Chromohalobacter sp.]TDU22964.1 hypothetical protein C8E00_103336 [Chromohalobacter marismortui]
MLKPLPTISFGPSRLALAAHVLLWGGVSGVVLALGPAWLKLAVSLSGAVLLGYWWRGQQHWELRERVDGEQTTWQWRKVSGQWQNVVPRPLRIGAWLIGLRLGRRVIWLWPDSADRVSRRLFRVRLLATMPLERR